MGTGTLRPENAPTEEEGCIELRLSPAVMTLLLSPTILGKKRILATQGKTSDMGLECKLNDNGKVVWG